MNRDRLRQTVAVFACWTITAPLLSAQSPQNEIIAPVRPKAPIIIRPYLAPYVPPAPLGNAQRLAGLIRAGKLYLTAQDAIALALENNIDVEVARYTPILDQWNLERARAGGALPGVPSAATQATSVAKGEGVRGSQAAAGVSTGGSGGTGNNTVNATVTQIGPVTPNLDPVFQDSSVFSHLSAPQANLQQSRVLNLIDNQRNYSATLQDGFLSGTQAQINYTESYLNENAPTDILNPQYAPTLSGTITQQLLQGRSVAVNSRTINIDKINLNIDDFNFKAQVISVVVDILNAYYGLVADYQDLKAKQSAADVARQFYQNNKRQVELGAMAPLDITTAEAQVASTEQDLVTSQATLEQQQISLKNLLSRNGTADPLLENAEIIPLDRIEVPENQQLPPLKELVATALTKRADLQAEAMHLKVDALTSLGTKNAVLPQLAGQASATNQGLSGSPQYVVQGPAQASATAAQTNPPGIVPCPPPNTGDVCEVSDRYLNGALTNALGQVFRRNYPTESATAYLRASIRNRQAQADAAIDMLSMRQDELQDRKDLNQVYVDVSNQRVLVEQAQARYLAAVKNRVLEQQLLEAEQKKFGLGASTPYNVVTQQRDLATAQSSEVAALVAFSNARIALQQTVGTTLEDNHVNLEEARTGIVRRSSALPASLPERP